MKWLLATAFALALPLAGVQQPGAATYFKGLSLSDQDGRRVDLYTDVIEGHVVLIHTFFTSCEGSCPILIGSLSSLQTRFAADLGHRLRFVSITVDPRNDTPQKLRAYAERTKARNGWLFLTGTQLEIDTALTRLGQYVKSPDAHSNVMIVGNEPTGLWKKVFGLSSARAVGDAVDSVLNDRAP
ncbi:MAG TPA: SCO family protein [Vicinamibacterales bacterium]|nr:SCO family protein [Vicinamibacterales bacterium]